MTDFDQLDLHRVERELGRRRLRSDFEPEVEREYVLAVRQQRAGTRTAMFVVLSLIYALNPFLQPWLFGVPPQVGELLFWLQAAVVVPMMLGAVAVSSTMSVNPLLGRAVQQGAVLAACVVELLQRHFALTGGHPYPAETFMLVILAAASFGGFGPLRLTLGVAILTTVAIWQELHWALDPLAVRGQVFLLLTLALIAVFGSYTTGRINRRAWLHRTHADLLSRTDALTGLPNRLNFNRLLVRSFSQARRQGVTVGVLMLDVDHFKLVNDRHGHLFGDEVLRRIGRILLEEVARRPLDTKARFGGEEMVVVWYDINPDFLQAQAEVLQEAIRTLDLQAPDGSRLRVSASLGVTWQVPDEATDPEDLLRHADALMYRAKALGRDRLVMEAYAA